MSHIDFEDKTKQPEDAVLRDALRSTKGFWDDLISQLVQEYEPVTQAWGFYKSWSLRLKRKKRTILYMIPQAGHFLCAFVFGGKATEAARCAGLPNEVLRTIDDARVYAEGRGFRLEVRNKNDLAVMLKLAAIKMAN